MSKTRPILFSAPMVRALLDGSKTQTRRVMARQKKYDFTDYTLFGQRGHADDEAERRGGWAQPWVAVEHAPDWPDSKEDQCQCPYATQRGERLWVRETYWIDDEDNAIIYRADKDSEIVDMNKHETGSSRYNWKPAIFMPRAMSRITLEITGLRVERLQQISQADAIAEGAPPSHQSIDLVSREFGYPDFSRSWYAQLWKHINGPGSWDLNPWVWVIEFKRVPA